MEELDTACAALEQSVKEAKQMLGAFWNWKLCEDRVLIRRIEPRSALLLTDKPKSIKGIVLAVGPGKWVPGTWWKVNVNNHMEMDCRDWVWFDGYREPVSVHPGQIVAFNSRWNDLAHAENKGTGADGKGALERPLSYKLDKLTHLVREADIFGILPHENVKVEYVGTAVERDYFFNAGSTEPGVQLRKIV